MSMRHNLINTLRLLTLAHLLSLGAWGDIVGTAHDLSIAKDGTNACNYCHTPHGALPNTPLWNHKLSDKVYNIYASSSLDANVGQPTGSSKLCLSCHDGTVALTDQVRGGTGTSMMPAGPGHLGTDLSDDHPISFTYSKELTDEDPQIHPVESLPNIFRFDRFGELQCVTCHNPHNNTFGKFMVMSNTKSLLCLQCHNLSGWSTSIHESSNVLTENVDDDYLLTTPYATVSENGCLSCHRPHSAGGAERLLHFEKEEDNCLSCHNGKVAKTNFNERLNKLSGHFVQNYEGIHDIREQIDSAELHVECVDCHNPHAVTQKAHQHGRTVGTMKRVSGVSSEGTPVTQATFEYEVCFKCHGQNPNRVDSVITRQITQTNTIMEFDPSNPSHHAVIIQGKNPDVPSLKAGMDRTTVITCTDCHSAEQASSTRGPHTSKFAPLLAYRYDTGDAVPESELAFALCYQCHDRESILNNESFAGHEKHIKKNVSCSVCHDPHGVNSAQGNSLNNSHLINFDTSIVFSVEVNGMEQLMFEDEGKFQGRCFLECHNVKHLPKSYKPKGFGNPLNTGERSR